MVFNHAQWDSIRRGDFFVSVAPVRPGKLRRNRKYASAESQLGCAIS